MTTHYRFLMPLDVLYLRGNKLFGDAGSYGESLIPPWPSVAAGAIRSRMLVDDGIDLAAFARGEITHPTLGTPTAPGSFTVSDFRLAQKTGDQVQTLHALPADMVVSASGTEHADAVRLIRPCALAAGILSSATLPQHAVLAEDERAKAAGGWWLTQDGWRAYVAGNVPGAEHLIHQRKLWKIDERVGVGLDPDTRSADDGKLFTVQAIALADGVGFVVGAQGAELPSNGLLRLGGDGRAAAILKARDYAAPQPDYAVIAKSGRCRIVLTTPGLFEAGWMLPGVAQDLSWQLGEARGRLVCAAVPRAETISGWDLARWQPKPAQRVAPTGSVYWIEDLQATPDGLRKLSEAALWRSPDENPSRRAEGYNRFACAAWTRDSP